MPEVSEVRGVDLHSCGKRRALPLFLVRRGRYFWSRRWAQARRARSGAVNDADWRFPIRPAAAAHGLIVDGDAAHGRLHEQNGFGFSLIAPAL